jgi:UDP-glucuronate decarboxylase
MRNPVIAADLARIAAADLPWEKLRGKRVLVSGAAGFLPSYMVETLLFLNETRGMNVRVVGLVRNLARAAETFAHHRGRADLELLGQDICEGVAIEGPIDFVIHAASQATPKVFAADPVGTLLPNVVGTHNLLKLAADRHVEAFLFFSTSGVYGFVDADKYPIPEDCWGALNPLDVASSYLESKRMGENMCAAFRHQFGVPIKIVRPAITYGPGIKLDDGRSFADFIADVIARRDIELTSDGAALRNFCYVADATAGFFLVMLAGEVGHAYNVASDRDISIRQLAELLVNEVFPERGLKVVMKSDPSKQFMRMNFSRTTVDISKAKKLGWKPSFTLEEGFRRTVESYERKTADGTTKP